MKKYHLLSGKLRSILAGCISILVVGTAAGCGVTDIEPALAPSQADKTEISEVETETEAPKSIAEEKESKEEADAKETKVDASTKTSVENSATEEKIDKNGEVYILFTSDVHCGIDEGFGYAGLAAIRDKLESEGYETILVDDGDAIQGEAVGTLTKGENIVRIMNKLNYDLAIPGNHEFDYGMDNFLELAENEAEYKYICCNFTKNDKLVFEPYAIKEIAGMKIGFVGVTTPTSITTSTPKYFQDDKGNYIYGFLQDDTGQKVYEAVQKAVDDVRKEGADLVYVIGHMGLYDTYSPWTYKDIIEHTEGIDVFLDGHSHDTEQIVMKDKSGKEVTRSAVGTKLNCIGYSHISADKKVLKTDVWSWPNKDSAPALLGINNEIGDMVQEVKAELGEKMNEVVAKTDVELTVNDPKETDNNGNPIRMVRRAETNLGDFCADAYRWSSGADIAIANGGCIRANIEKGDITYGNIIDVFPYGNMVSMIEVTGQQILDALEWGARSIPDECGGFLQVSGLSYEVNTKIDSPCIADDHSMFVGIKGERRVQNVLVGDKPIDPKATYTLACHDYTIQDKGDGFTMFDGDKVIEDRFKLDNQVLIEYITEKLGGAVGGEYSDPYGDGRIRILE
ncbi:bifunctional metallophosphatase/5'-nucleotidase [Oribacterium sp. P6A1]|uniref:bifunctional metallophosphatase/5'-nucleotidase n=1 Tax=Oribacterium sp. P6A1 TaxID=1410612 RepID=UPI0009DDAAED|nr:bifunctional UDP-sugar hydrolase/5'-nucleotidase [Oribacterium sp. P6A1]